ncbi:xanthine dehydrogenase family protein subunit M [Mycolicibacterium sp. BiH015]|uniref:FAD binding domain-containing protein n=1 Tax=Mycolicibacterium sp. BiH015 TaxID=3018808 RepID=UPI0022E0E7AF|nr:xanthine dehydrogenase family protein subunit M [Mycolicibacterium sp. BiH015]MDA2894551.1 xanthine dehydrogenase family protein subunit M [Mycolicibacterium sp. BiH015]
MLTFDYQRAGSVADAISRVSAEGARFYAGGTNLLDLMKSGVESPAVLVDVRGLGLNEIEETAAGGITIGAGATNSAVANHALVRNRYPVLSQAILSGATTQIRNMATVGGNLMQRTRCPYFMNPATGPCHKRVPGSGCAARDGFHREHAVFGTSLPCVAVHPSDMVVALAALDAVVHVTGPDGARAIGIRDFYVSPAAPSDPDTCLRPGELIVAVELPPSPFKSHSWYLKVRDRHSYAFALVSVAAAVHLDDGVIVSAAVALGGVAATPWRVPAAEAALTGQAPHRQAFEAAAEVVLAGASPLQHNGFKVTLAKNSVVRALSEATARTS